MKIYQIYKNLTIEILEIECSKVSDKCYWDLKGKRYMLETNYTECFLDKNTAILSLSHRLKSKILALKQNLGFYENELNEFKNKYE